MIDESILDQLHELRTTLHRNCWGSDTSASPRIGRPSSTGQCAVTALLVQDLFGGELARTVVDGDSHYFNLIDGAEVDLTRDQFKVWAPTAPVETRTRAYVLSHPATVARFDLLVERYLDAIYSTDEQVA